MKRNPRKGLRIKKLDVFVRNNVCFLPDLIKSFNTSPTKILDYSSRPCHFTVLLLKIACNSRRVEVHSKRCNEKSNHFGKCRKLKYVSSPWSPHIYSSCHGLHFKHISSHLIRVQKPIFMHCCWYASATAKTTCVHFSGTCSHMKKKRWLLGIRAFDSPPSLSSVA